MKARPVIAALLLLAASGAQAREVFQFGGAGGEAWEDQGTLTFIDVESEPGSIRPFETDPTHNLVSSMESRGGFLRSLLNTYTLDEAWVRGESELVIDDDPTTAYVHEPRIVILGGGGGFWTVPMFFDLGAPFLVDRIRFYTRDDHPENVMRQYVLWLNDGSEETKDRLGDPVWSKYRTEIDNLESAVEIPIEPPQMVRHIRLRPGTEASNGGLADTWEVAEFEVYGQGFVPEATYLSEPLDLGEPVSLGQIHWDWQLDEGAKILVQTRTGSDDQPFIYWRKTGIGDQISPLDEQGRPLTAEAYAELVSSRAGITDDLQNWSPWQTYELEDGAAGTQILSPSPRRYLQIRVRMTSVGLAGGQLDSLRFEYSRPPVAAAVGEVHPTLVEPGISTDFTYAIRARLEDDHRGFNAVRLSSEARLDSVVEVRVDRQVVSAQVTHDDDGSWLIEFPRIDADQTLLEVDFRARVYRYGTPVHATVIDADVDDVPLAVVAGDAVAEFADDEVMVRIGLEDDLISGLAVQPNPFTPNGDGRNDRATISFSLLRLVDQTPIRLRVFDLSGRLVRDLTVAAQGSQAVAVEWDGTDDAGQTVPPGVYLYRLVVDADVGGQERVGQIAVAY